MAATSSALDRVLGGSLWRNADFSKLWAGQFISEAGTAVTQLALPTVAILLLRATPFQVGLLAALEFLAFPVLGLVAGVYADRMRRLRIMVVCDAARLVLLASVPVAWLAGWLRIEQLYAVALLAGVATVFFDVGYQSYLPSLIARRDLVEGNTKLEVTRSTAQLGGPALAGFLIQLAGAAQAIWFDAASYFVSVLSLLAITKPEPAPRPAREDGQRSSFAAELWEGMEVVLRNPTLWKIAGSTATSNLGSNMLGAVMLIYAYRNLHLSPAVVGLIFAIGAAGGVIGALTAGWWARLLGVGPALLVSIGLGGLADFLVPAAQVLPAVPVLIAVFFLGFFFGPIYNVNQVSLRQTMVPDRLQGRMNATMRTIVWGTIPVGAFAGGVLASTLGVVPTIWLGAVVATLAALWIVAGPVRLKEMPQASPD